MAFRRRLLVLLLVTAAAMTVVWGRLLQLQIVKGDGYRRAAEASTRRTESVLGPRGRIVDVKGEPLAHDRSVVQLVFSPEEWATRERFRCRRCGTVLFSRTPRHFDRDGQPVVPPKACTCGAKRDELDAMPVEDLEPLETSLNLPPGTLAATADDRMDSIERTIAIVTTNRVLGLEKSVKARARELERPIRAQLGVGVARARTIAVDRVLAELAPELAEHAFEADDVRVEQRTDRFARPIVFAEFVGSGGTRIPLKRLSPEAERLLELDRDGRYRGFRAELARERWYPHHGLVAQLIGITGSFASADEMEAFRTRYGADTVLAETRVGRMGLESRYDEELRGLPGVVVREKDDAGAFSETRVMRAPVRGKDVKLHLDVNACEEAHRILADAATDEGFGGEGAASAAFVVMEAETGHVVTWAEAPVFDLDGNLNQITKRIEDNDGETRAVVAADATADPAADPVFFTIVEPRPSISLSRVARVPVEPGSSLKILTAFSLLHAGHALPAAYVCAGLSRGPNDLPGCHGSHTVDLVEMLAVSCNRFCADCSSDRAFFGVHRDLFPEWAATCGIGRPCGIDFPSASSGSYPKTLEPSTIRQVAIGQAVTATPLQMARLAALVANGHFLPFPRIAADIDGVPVRDGGVEVDLDPTALSKVRAGMRGCVETGTAKGRFEGDAALAGVTVYGKTGTATVAPKSKDWSSADPDDQVTKGPWHLWFVGYSMKPGTPTLAFACVLHARKIGAGGDLAAPVVARFLHYWYAR